jgi:hypothetical protein
MAALHWYITHDGHRLGPFRPPELEQLATAGLLRPTDLLWTEGLSGWMEASRFPALFPPTGQKRYWLSLAGQTRGPYALERIRLAVAARQVTADTPACPEGDTRWAPLGQMTEFRGQSTTANSSQARLVTVSLGAEEAELYLAGKQGDDLAKLISTLLDMKKSYATNPVLVETLTRSIAVLQAKREEAARRPVG